jgi:hypothetical protein
MTGFTLIDTEREGRIIRQTYARGLGQAGCLVLVSTTVYSQIEKMAQPGQPAGGIMSTDEMISNCPIETVTESLAYVPGVKIGDEGLQVIEGYGETPQTPVFPEEGSE